mgnify:CR=1 FL=1
MSTEPLKDPDGKPLDPAAQAVVDRARRMSMLSGVATVLGIAVVIVMIGWRLYRSAESAPPPQADVVATLPKGAKRKRGVRPQNDADWFEDENGEMVSSFTPARVRRTGMFTPVAAVPLNDIAEGEGKSDAAVVRNAVITRRR